MKLRENRPERLTGEHMFAMIRESQVKAERSGQRRGRKAQPLTMPPLAGGRKSAILDKGIGILGSRRSEQTGSSGGPVRFKDPKS
jgi:hypothetical protein